MILYEFEGKELLKKAGVNVPKSQLVDSPKQKITLTPPLVLKAQVLSGKRAKAGGVVKVNQGDDLETSLGMLFKREINGEKVEQVLIEEKVSFNSEYYLSISYDSDFRAPVLTFSSSGGTGVEEKGKIQSYQINPITLSINPEHKNRTSLPQQLIEQLIKLFFEQEMLLLEINPLVKNTNQEWVALDSKIKLDDDAMVRHEEWNYSPRSAPGHTPSIREIEAKKIDQGDYRGVAGSTYFDLNGDIAILSSGGGVSLTAMDALIKANGKPANFTEYSGNPPKEKVTKLTKIVLSKSGLAGLWIIGTVAANFTDIYETLSGIVDGIREFEKENNTKIKFPIVVRRGGPRDKEAFEMLRQTKDLDFHLQDEEVSISESAKIMVDLANKYKISCNMA